MARPRKSKTSRTPGSQTNKAGTDQSDTEITAAGTESVESDAKTNLGSDDIESTGADSATVGENDTSDAKSSSSVEGIDGADTVESAKDENAAIDGAADTDGTDSLADKSDETDPVPETETTAESSKELVDGSVMKSDSDSFGTDADTLDEDTPIAATDRDDSLGKDDRHGRDSDISPRSAMGAAAAAPATTTVIERKGGFVPMVLGGLVAAGIGFVAGDSSGLNLFGTTEEDPFREEVTLSIEGQTAEIADLTEQLAEARTAIGLLDMAPVMSAIGSVEDRLTETDGTISSLANDIGAQIAVVEDRLTTIEKQPLDTAVSDAAIAAYERELEKLSASVQAQREAVEVQRAEIEAMAAEAIANETSAANQAVLAANRVALAEVTSLVQSGKPFGDALNKLEVGGVSVPDVLAANADSGVPTQATLATDFPDLARVALRDSRSAESDESDGLGGFLQAQLGARSVTPQEGDDTDAILSRAEAAVRIGDLDGALTEIAALPDPAKAALADWVAQAETRRGALDATTQLTQELNQQ